MRYCLFASLLFGLVSNGFALEAIAGTPAKCLKQGVEARFDEKVYYENGLVVKVEKGGATYTLEGGFLVKVVSYDGMVINFNRGVVERITTVNGITKYYEHGEWIYLIDEKSGAMYINKCEKEFVPGKRD